MRRSISLLYLIGSLIILFGCKKSDFETIRLNTFSLDGAVFQVRYAKGFQPGNAGYPYSVTIASDSDQLFVNFAEKPYSTGRYKIVNQVNEPNDANVLYRGTHGICTSRENTSSSVYVQRIGDSLRISIKDVFLGNVINPNADTITANAFVNVLL